MMFGFGDSTIMIQMEAVNRHSAESFGHVALIFHKSEQS